MDPLLTVAFAAIGSFLQIGQLILGNALRPNPSSDAHSPAKPSRVDGKTLKAFVDNNPTTLKLSTWLTAQFAPHSAKSHARLRNANICSEAASPDASRGVRPAAPNFLDTSEDRSFVRVLIFSPSQVWKLILRYSIRIQATKDRQDLVPCIKRRPVWVGIISSRWESMRSKYNRTATRTSATTQETSPKLTINHLKASTVHRPDLVLGWHAWQDDLLGVAIGIAYVRGLSYLPGRSPRILASQQTQTCSLARPCRVPSEPSHCGFPGLQRVVDRALLRKNLSITENE
ncbi:unnamed protein product [Diplocarpon coronariae]